MANSSKTVNPEDVILYIITALLLIFVGFYFWDGVHKISGQFTFNDPKVPDQYIYQYENNKLKYEFSLKALLANTIRNNMSFMIGSMMCILGTMIVIRRVRADTQAEANKEGTGSFKFQSNSAGVTITFLGTLILIMSLVLKDKYEIADSNAETNTYQPPAAKADTLHKPGPVKWH